MSEASMRVLSHLADEMRYSSVGELALAVVTDQWELPTGDDGERLVETLWQGMWDDIVAMIEQYTGDYHQGMRRYKYEIVVDPLMRGYFCRRAVLEYLIGRACDELAEHYDFPNEILVARKLMPISFRVHMMRDKTDGDIDVLVKAFGCGEPALRRFLVAARDAVPITPGE